MVPLRMPSLFNLRSDPFERAQHEAGDYVRWFVEHAFVRRRATSSRKQCNFYRVRYGSRRHGDDPNVVLHTIQVLKDLSWSSNSKALEMSDLNPKSAKPDLHRHIHRQTP